MIEGRRWLSETRFLHVLGDCELLPGPAWPEAQQLAMDAGWCVGGLVAGSLFVLPGLAVLMALSLAYVAAADAHWLSEVFSASTRWFWSWSPRRSYEPVASAGI